MSDQSMRVVSWNIELGIDVEGAIAALTEIDVLDQPDIVLLQEMDPDGVAAIAERLGFGHRYAAADAHAKTGRPFGNAVLSPWPMHDEREVPLPHVAAIMGQARSALHCVVEVGERSVVAYSVHAEIPTLPLLLRRRQFAAIARDCLGNTTEGSAVVVGGDFNTATSRGQRALGDAMRTAGLEPGCVDREPTLWRFGQPMRLDHLFVRGLTCIASGVSHEPTASDHYPVWADFGHAS